MHNPSSSRFKKRSSDKLSVRRWSDNTAYFSTNCTRSLPWPVEKLSQIHQITKNQKQYQP